VEWKWLRILSKGGRGFSGVDLSGYTARELAEVRLVLFRVLDYSFMFRLPEVTCNSLYKV
jgi:hypothetical protein